MFIGLSIAHLYLFLNGYYSNLPYYNDYPLAFLLGPVAALSIIPINGRLVSIVRRRRQTGPKQVVVEKKEEVKEEKVEETHEKEVKEEVKEETVPVPQTNPVIEDKVIDELKLQIVNVENKVEEIEDRLNVVSKTVNSLAEGIRDVQENMNSVLADIRALMNEAENPFMKLKLQEVDGGEQVLVSAQPPQQPSQPSFSQPSQPPVNPTSVIEPQPSFQEKPQKRSKPSEVSKIIGLTQIVEEVLKRYPIKDIDEVLTKYLELGLISEKDLLTIYNLIDIFLSTRVETEKMIELLYKFKDYLGIDDPSLELEAIRRKIRRLDMERGGQR